VSKACHQRFTKARLRSSQDCRLTRSDTNRFERIRRESAGGPFAGSPACGRHPEHGKWRTMGSRLYDPTEGRFTSQDTQFGTPTDPATLNQSAAHVQPLQPQRNPGSDRQMGRRIRRQPGPDERRSYFESQATSWAAHPSPPPKPAPPPPAAARPIVAQLRGLPTGRSLRRGATSIHGSGDYCVTPPRGSGILPRFIAHGGLQVGCQAGDQGESTLNTAEWTRSHGARSILRRLTLETTRLFMAGGDCGDPRRSSLHTS